MSFTSVKKSRFISWFQKSIAYAGVATAVAFAAACGSDDATQASGKAAKCTLASDCAGGLVCSFGLCHAECATNKDCPANQRCFKAAAGDAGQSSNVCQVQEEATCHYRSDCKKPLVCAVDLQCRNQCQDDVDCVTG